MLSEYGRGESHKCTKGNMAENLAKSVSYDVWQKLASATQKEALPSLKCMSKENNNTVHRKTVGSKLIVWLISKERKAKMIFLENVVDMLSKNPLSFKQTLNVLSEFWRASGRKIVEANIMDGTASGTFEAFLFFFFFSKSLFFLLLNYKLY